MNEKDAAPIVPVLPGETSVSDASHHAGLYAARAVVEIGHGYFRLHATPALASLERGHQGHFRLNELDAISFGLAGERLQPRGPDRLDEPHNEVALLVSIARLPSPFGSSETGARARRRGTSRRGIPEVSSDEYLRGGVPDVVSRSGTPRRGIPELSSDEYLRAVVSRKYKCPSDGEAFSGPGVCDLHNLALVLATDP